MSLEKRMNAIEDRLKINMTPKEAEHNQELKRRIDEARKRCGIERRDQGGDVDVDHGASLFDRLKAARERHTSAKEGNNRTDQE